MTGMDKRVTKHFAVFGDTHGHIRLMFRLCQLWQINNQAYLDGIFQCGDLGYYPDSRNLDKATKRFSMKDPEELGFKYFTKPRPIVSDPKLIEILQGSDSGYGNVKCPAYFCHGNHEDFQSLHAEVGNSDIKSIDYFEKLFWLRPGYVHQAGGIRIAAVGGGTEPIDVSENDYGLEEPWKWVINQACKNLEDMKFHVLLSHTSPKGIGGGSDKWGSTRLRRLVEVVQPFYHFFAHHEDRIKPASIENTKCYWLNDVNFTREAKTIKMPLEKGCMGILSWEDEKNHDFNLVNDDWFKKVNYLNWWNE